MAMTGPTIQATTSPPKAPVLDGRKGGGGWWVGGGLIMSEKGLEALNKKR